MGKNPADQFYYTDWLNDTELQMASASTRGIWINLLGKMWTSNSRPRGTLTFSIEKGPQTANCTIQEFNLFLEEAKQHAFCDICVTGHGVVTVINRRLKRDENRRNEWRKRKRRQRMVSNVTLESNDCHTVSSSSSTSKNNIYSEILDHLNANAKTNFRASSRATQRLINGRMKEGYTVDDFKKVIGLKCKQWLNDKDMVRYLRPQTLFRPSNFEAYVNEKESVSEYGFKSD